jgi:hypothetical protein
MQTCLERPKPRIVSLGMALPEPLAFIAAGHLRTALVLVVRPRKRGPAHRGQLLTHGHSPQDTTHAPEQHAAFWVEG